METTVTTPDQQLEQVTSREYEWGFVTDIESDTLPPGLTPPLTLVSLRLADSLLGIFAYLPEKVHFRNSLP